MVAQRDLIEHGDEIPPGSRRIGWRVPVAVAVVVALAVGGYVVRTNKKDLDEQGFARIGTVEGVTLWGRVEHRNTRDWLTLRNTGWFEGQCDTEGPYERGFLSCFAQPGEGGYLVIALVDPGEWASVITNRKAISMDVIPAPAGWAHDFAVLVDPNRQLGDLRSIRLPSK